MKELFAELRELKERSFKYYTRVMYVELGYDPCVMWDIPSEVRRSVERRAWELVSITVRDHVSNTLKENNLELIVLEG